MSAGGIGAISCQPSVLPIKLYNNILQIIRMIRAFPIGAVAPATILVQTRAVTFSGQIRQTSHCESKPGKYSAYLQQISAHYRVELRPEHPIPACDKRGSWANPVTKRCQCCPRYGGEPQKATPSIERDNASQRATRITPNNSNFNEGRNVLVP